MSSWGWMMYLSALKPLLLLISWFIVYYRKLFKFHNTKNLLHTFVGTRMHHFQGHDSWDQGRCLPWDIGLAMSYAIGGNTSTPWAQGEPPKHGWYCIHSIRKNWEVVRNVLPWICLCIGTSYRSSIYYQNPTIYFYLKIFVRGY